MTAVQTPTVVAELTPPGRGAVAVVVVAGPRALECVERHFHSATGRCLQRAHYGQICYGRWLAADGEDVVVVRKAAADHRIPHVVEVHCHGGRVAVQAVIGALISSGCAQVSWTQWLDLVEADAVKRAALCALTKAPTARTAAVLMDQYHGALGEVLCQTRAALQRTDLAEADRLLDEMLRYADVGMHLTRPWRVVLSGPPNVGKSSLINCLAGFERAIVSPTPGTTRDVVTVTTAIDGWPIELADTAGLRTTTDELEHQGVRLAGKTAALADLVVHVRDARDRESGVAPLADQRPSKNLLVLNKVDLIPDTERVAIEPADEQTLSTSTLTGEGIPRLLDAIAKQLVPEPPPSGAAVPFDPLQVAALRAAWRACDAGNASNAEQAILGLMDASP